jgi:hypothetical protein
MHSRCGRAKYKIKDRTGVRELRFPVTLITIFKPNLWKFVDKVKLNFLRISFLCVLFHSIHKATRSNLGLYILNYLYIYLYIYIS